MDKRAVSRQDRRQTRCLETTFWPPTLSRDNYFCLETTFLSSTLCRDNLFCLETTFLSPTLSRDNVFAHLETTKKTSYNKKDNLRRYTPRRGNYGKITTQVVPPATTSASVYALSWFSWVVTDHVFLGRNGTSFTGGVRFWDFCPPVGILAHPPPTRAPLRPDRDANPDTPP